VNLYWIFGILIVMYCLFEWNLSVYRRFSRKPVNHYPSVSVLVPCRNEKERIENNLKTLLEQDYPDFEVAALDDDSTDGTGEVLERLEKTYSRMHFIQGQGLPSGWQGKNHACHKLAQEAKGEWLLFVDADTEHHPQMLKHAVQSALHGGASLLSTFPRQRFGSWGDALVVPLMFFVVLTYLPMYFVSKKTWKWAGNFSTACGQFLLVSKEAYWKAGGHEAIREKISEAPLLAKRVKDLGKKVLLLDGSPWVSCQMYQGFWAAFKGFSRSLFASMGGSVAAVLFFLVVQTYLFVAPYVMLAHGLIFGGLSSEIFSLLVFCIAIPLWMRYRIHTRK